MRACYCGYTLPDAARRMGHSGALHLQTYAHVSDSLGTKRYADLAALIAAARADRVFRHGSAGAR